MKKYFVSILMVLLLVLTCNAQNVIVNFNKEKCLIELTVDNELYTFDCIPDFSAHEFNYLYSYSDSTFLLAYSFTGISYIYTDWQILKNPVDIALMNVSGEFPDRMDYDHRVKYCALKNLNIPIKYINSDDISNKLMNDINCYCTYGGSETWEELFEKIQTAYENDDLFIKGKDIGRYKAYIEYYPITAGNARQYEKIAYYLNESELYSEAVFVLKELIKNNQVNATTWLILGDAQWGEENTKDAISSYKIYMKLMKENSKNIPLRVFDRMK